MWDSYLSDAGVLTWVGSEDQVCSSADCCGLFWVQNKPWPWYICIYQSLATLRDPKSGSEGLSIGFSICGWRMMLFFLCWWCKKCSFPLIVAHIAYITRACLAFILTSMLFIMLHIFASNKTAILMGGFKGWSNKHWSSGLSCLWIQAESVPCHRTTEKDFSKTYTSKTANRF